MKQRLQNLCDSRVTALIILQIIPLIPTLITVCTNFSVPVLIAFLIAIAIALWLISGLVKVQKGALEAGTNTIRRFMKFDYVLICILCVIAGITMLFVIIGSLNPTDETNKAIFLLLLLVGYLAFIAYDLIAVRALKNTARRAYDIACGTESIGRQGKLPEISCLISIVFSLLPLLLPPVLNGALDSKLTGRMTFTNITFVSLLSTGLTIIRSVIAYTLLRDFRKAVNE